MELVKEYPHYEIEEKFVRRLIQKYGDSFTISIPAKFLKLLKKADYSFGDFSLSKLKETPKGDTVYLLLAHERGNEKKKFMVICFREEDWREDF